MYQRFMQKYKPKLLDMSELGCKFQVIRNLSYWI